VERRLFVCWKVCDYDTGMRTEWRVGCYRHRRLTDKNKQALKVRHWQYTRGSTVQKDKRKQEEAAEIAPFTFVSDGRVAPEEGRKCEKAEKDRVVTCYPATQRQQKETRREEKRGDGG
jgi:hypothetical protein